MSDPLPIAAPRADVSHLGRKNSTLLPRRPSARAWAVRLATLLCAALIAGMPRARLAPAWFLGGSLLFSGSLYALALGAPRWTAIVTPFGGLLFLAGWAVLAWAARGVDRA